MIKAVDYLYHFTNGAMAAIESILMEGIKPSYAVETLNNREILIPMVSFSNVLLRDVGENEVLNYGSYAIGVTRDWGVKNNFNPVIYTHDNGILKNAFNSFIDNSALLGHLHKWKDSFRQLSDAGAIVSKQMKFDHVSPNSVELIDALTEKAKFNDRVFDAVSQVSANNFESAKQLLLLMKPYEVYNKAGEKFIAYNDREWRRVFDDLDFIDSENEKDDFNSILATPKPHINDPNYCTKLHLGDIRAIVIKENAEGATIFNMLAAIFDKAEVEECIKSGDLAIGTLKDLIQKNY